MTEAASPLSNDQVQELLRIALRTYHDQAEMCYKAKAYLACCIMAGAVVEAVLTATVCYLYDDALKTGKAPNYKGDHPRKGEIKELLEWQLYDLLAVAKKAKWLPEKLTLEKRIDLREVKTPVSPDSIRKLRNLVHPARYLQDRLGKDYTQNELVTLYATCHEVYTHVQNVLVKHIRKSHPSYDPLWL
jgi:hypothetical protein